MSATGLKALVLAQGWIGTPYRHQGATRGVGCDCLGLIRGVWRELYGEEPEEPPPYAPDWAERAGNAGNERLLEAATRHFGQPLPPDAAEPSDVLLFRWRDGCAAKHAGILAGPEHFIHAYEQAAVVRSALVASWRRRIVATFRFPDR